MSEPSVSSSDLEYARTVAERLKKEGEANASGAQASGGYVRFRATFGSTAPQPVAPPPPAAAPAPATEALPAPPPIEDLPTFGQEAWDALLDWCLAAAGAESAFIIDDHGLPVADRGTVAAGQLEEIGARLAGAFDLANRMELGVAADALTIEFGERRLSGISVDFGASQYLTVGVLGPRAVTPQMRRVVSEVLRKWMGAE